MGDDRSPGDAFGVDSTAGSLRRVAMRRPGAILAGDAGAWHYTKSLEPSVLVAQYQAFTQLAAAGGARIHWLPADDADGFADSVFAYDPSSLIPTGAIILRPGKRAGRAEAGLDRALYEGLMPIVGTRCRLLDFDLRRAACLSVVRRIVPHGGRQLVHECSHSPDDFIGCFGEVDAGSANPILDRSLRKDPIPQHQSTVPNVTRNSPPANLALSTWRRRSESGNTIDRR